MELRNDYAQNWVNSNKSKNPAKQSWVTGGFQWQREY